MKKFFKSRIFLVCTSCALILLLVAFVGYSLRDSADASTKKIALKTTTTTTTSTSTTTTTAAPMLIQPAPGALPLLGAGVTLASGSTNPNLPAYEQRMVDIKLDPGTVDDKFDSSTNFAVQTLQKLKGLPVNGVLGDAEILALNTFQFNEPHVFPGESNRLEVNLDTQIGTVYQNYQVRLVTTVSTGNQASYSYVSKKTGRSVSSKANTPTGKFEFFRRYKGWEKSDLGRLYNPVYFKGGIAVHGYPSVPAKPASHGCVRIPMYIAEYFPGLVENGNTVYVYGSQEVSYYADRVGPVVTAAPTTIAPAPAPTPTTTTSSTSTTTTTTTLPTP